MAVKIINQTEIFDQLVKSGYKLIKLSSKLTPMNEGYTKPNFIYETEFKENQNYGIVGGSIHETKDGGKGMLLFVDFDIKEKIKENNEIITRIIPEAQDKLKDVFKIVSDKDYYFANTKTNGLHMGILVSEDIQQSVSLYRHRDCEKLRIDTRTKLGYVNAIAENYEIIKIPKLFDKVITSFEDFMFSISFENSNNKETKSDHSGGLSDDYKRKARQVLDSMDVSKFPELGTEKCSTHDFISFSVMSCRSRNIPLNETTEKIMNILSRITTSKDNTKTEKEIEKMYESEYLGFEFKNKKSKNNEIDIYKIAGQLMNEYKFITLEGSRVKEILFYKDGVYREFGEDIVSKRSRKIINDIKLNHINEIKGIIRDETGYISHDEFDKEPYLVNMKNKIFNLKTGEIIDHSPEYFSRVKIPVYYDPDAKCPRFDKFLESSLVSFEENDDGNKKEEIDERKIRTILEMIALCLIKDNDLLQKAFMNTGSGSNGKSVLFGIIVALIGKINISAKTIHDFEKNHFASSSLEGKLCNICADVGSKGIFETESLKKIISGDPVDCERKFRDTYTFTPYSTLIFSANDIPEVTDESDGFARRFELIEWEKSFYGKDRDNTVKTIRKDPNELSGIFNKVSKIAKELLDTQSLKYESTVEDAKIKWLKKSDSTQRFLDELTSRNSDYFCPSPIIFSRYNKFCKDNGMTPLNDRRFNLKLEKLGLSRVQKKVDGNNLRVWVGIDLISQLNKDNEKIDKGN